jgi:hypothetical protein
MVRHPCHQNIVFYEKIVGKSEWDIYLQDHASLLSKMREIQNRANKLKDIIEKKWRINDK